MNRVLLVAAAVLAHLVMAPASGRAEIRRLAVVVGNNHGSGAQPALAFAERDAQRVAEVLTELGGVARADVALLRGPSLAGLQRALAGVTREVQSFQRGLTRQVVLLFYFSGHSDGEALEIGKEMLPFAEVRRWLRETGASVRLAIVDSCRSGALLRIKGGTLGPPFDVRLADNMASAGEAVITSSAPLEAALESAEIGGSFFSHHLVSGLRGAADSSGDGLVTLAEAYQYAFARTVTATADTTIGPQHPNYDYRLSGRGELVLTRIGRASGVVEVPAGFDRLLLIDSARDEVVAEVNGEARARRLATRPGAYEVRAWRDGRVFGARLRVRADSPVRLASGDLQPASVQGGRWKGPPPPALQASAPPADHDRHLRVSAGLGLARGVATSVGWLTALRVAAAPGWRGPTVAVTATTGRGQGFRESSLQLRPGYLTRWGGRRLRLLAGGELGGGVVFQDVTGGRLLSGGVATAAALVGVEWPAGVGPALQLIAAVDATAVRRDRRLRLLAIPGAWLGATF